MTEFINNFSQAWQDSSVGALILFGLFFLLVYFLPSLLAVFFNRRNLLTIAVLNIPAGFSLIAWGALVVWACTGKAGRYIQTKLAQRGQAAGVQ